MGMLMSVMGKGVPSVSMLTDALYGQFVDKKIKEFNDFHIAVLHIFCTVNASLPGKHYDVPQLDTIQTFFETWKTEADAEKKKKLFMEFISENVNASKLDEATILLGVATPPAAMALKRAGENIPQLNMIKFIPDVIFVPSATLITLISLKFSRRAAHHKRHITAAKAPVVGKI